ncbi:MAG: hypothetical protein JXR37_00230, partial [Kiritimatiellae bacterium]|nr:hypothetical protein [Kiritimatiellia bacterium]
EADSDGDGQSNGAEYIAGTDPGSGAHLFEVELAPSGAAIVVSFPTIAAAGTGYAGCTRYYALETRPGMDDGAWSAVSGYARITGAGQTVAYTNTPAGAEQVYRGRVWLE